LQEEIEYSRMCLLDLIEEQRPFVPSLQGAAQHALFAQSPSEQNTKTLPSLIFRHIKAKEAIYSEEITSEGECQLRLSHARGSEEEKAPTRTARRRKPKFSAMQHRHDRWQHMVLPQNLLSKPRLEKTQAFKASSRKRR
jgi:hypothetical protein